MAKVGEVLRYRDKGISVEEARKRMLEAGQAPTGILQETKKNSATGAVIPAATPEPTPTEAAEVEPTVVEAAPAVTPAPVVEVVAADKAERLETPKYVLEIRQEDGLWVAEITYKNGAGIERFEATTRKALDMKLLEGKARGTLRVREAVRREKYGIELDKEYSLPEGMTTEEYEQMPEVARKALIVALAKEAAMTFRETHPDYYFSDENAEKVMKFLSKRDYPVTYKNLEYAFEELADADELEQRPQPSVVSVPTSATPTADSAARAALAAQPATATTTAPAAVAPAPAPVGRTRGTTGLKPGFSSASTTLEETSEDGNESRVPSEAELRKASPIGKPPSKELRDAYQQTIAERRKLRQF